MAARTMEEAPLFVAQDDDDESLRNAMPSAAKDDEFAPAEFERCSLFLHPR